MSRRVYALGVGLALIALALAVTDALLWEPGVTEANFRRLRDGMTMEQVEAILGSPGQPLFAPGKLKEAPWAQLYRWAGDEGEVFMSAASDGRLVGPAWMPSGRPKPGPLPRLRAWLGW